MDEIGASVLLIAWSIHIVLWTTKLGVYRRLADLSSTNTHFFRLHLCELKFWAGVVFSDRLENHIVELANVHSLHPDSFALMLINFVAATLEFSHVLRANISTKTISMNLHNILVARSCKITTTWKPGAASHLFQLTGNLTWYDYFEACWK